MSEAGIFKVSYIMPSVVRLNVGGLDLNIPRSVFEGIREASSSSSWHLGDLFEGGVWDKRLPRAGDGRVVLDESPVCVEELLCDGASYSTGNTSLPDDQRPYLAYLSTGEETHSPKEKRRYAKT